MKKILSVLLSVIFTFLPCTLISAESRVNMPVRDGIGLNIADFSTVNLTGDVEVTSDILQEADITLINYWATWCGSCVEELPFLQNIHEHYSTTPEADVQILGVIDEVNGCTPGSAQALLDQKGITYTNLRADPVLKAAFDTSDYIPQTLVVDRDGNIRYQWIGGFTNYNSALNFCEMWLDIINNHDGEKCCITYLNDVTGEVLGTAEAEYGYPIPEPPEAPEMVGYIFNEWTYKGDVYLSEFEEISPIAMGDITASATYWTQKFKVNFYDGVTGKLLKVQSVDYGKGASAPDHPAHTGYEFQGWDADFSYIIAPLDVHGICVPVDVEFTKGDVDGNGAVEITDAVLTLRYTLSLVNFTPDQQLAADFNEDTVIDTMDAILILRSAIGL